jgi:hypothetical protein
MNGKLQIHYDRVVDLEFCRFMVKVSGKLKDFLCS